MSSLRALLAILLAAAPACDRGAPLAPAKSTARAELTFEGLTLRVYRKGVAQLRVRASHVELMRSTGALVARDARFEFFADGLTLHAPRLTGNVDSLGFDATEGVTFASSGSDPSSRFLGSTAAAHFEGKEGPRGIATGTHPIELTGLQGGRPFSMTARAFRFDVDAQHATFEAVQSKVGAP